MSLVLGREGAFYGFLAHFFISEGPRNWGPTDSKTPPEPRHEATRAPLSIPPKSLGLKLTVATSEVLFEPYSQKGGRVV